MSDTPRTDAEVAKMIRCNQSPDGLEYFARDLERENAALKACVDRTGEANDKLVVENAGLRAELEAQAVVNGKGGEREAKLLSIISRIRRLIDQELDWSQAQRLEKAGELCDEVLGKAEQP